MFFYLSYNMVGTSTKTNAMILVVISLTYEYKKYVYPIPQVSIYNIHLLFLILI